MTKKKTQRAFFNWDDMCELEMELPDIAIQQKYVSVYKAMLSNQRSYELGLEDLKLVCDGYIEDLSGLVLDKKMLSVINKIGNERLDSLTTTDFLAINALYYEKPLNENMRLRLKHLTEKGIVEHVSRNKYVLARSLYSAAGKTGIHTRRVGLDRETNKELLLKHIHDKGDEGAPLKELQQVLPGHNRGQIQVLLRELRKDGRTHCVGNTSAARWFEGPEDKA